MTEFQEVACLALLVGCMVCSFFIPIVVLPLVFLILYLTQDNGKE